MQSVHGAADVDWTNEVDKKIAISHKYMVLSIRRGIILSQTALRIAKDLLRKPLYLRRHIDCWFNGP